MNTPAFTTTRISGIDVADDRFISINGPALTRLPNWGLSVHTADVEYHLHPAITYEVHYRVPHYVLIHAFTGADGRSAIGAESIAHWRIDARTSCIVPPGQRVRVVQSTPLEFIALGISENRVDRIAASVVPGWSGLDLMFKTIDPAMSALFAEMRRCMIAEPVGTGAYLDTLTGALLTRLLSWHLTESSEQTDGPEMLSPALVRRIANMVEECLEDSIRVSDLVDAAGLSRAHFSRAFTHSFGMPARDYIRSRRIARARSLLTETDLSASEIAMRCGFANPSHLTTAFRQELGLTPTAYRRALASSSESS
ncbi:MAG: AraC family transcriptional regulator [Pseudomonadota bacterium]